MHKPTFYAAVFAIIRNDDGKILFSRRANTGHLDGYLSLPAGHIEIGELPSEAMKRELEEEIDIKNPHLKMIHSQQSINQSDGRTYFNFYFEVSEYTDTIVNLEVEKCSELLFLDTDCLEKEKVAPYVKLALEEIKKGSIFSEIAWSI